MRLLLIIAALFILASCSKNMKNETNKENTPDVVLNNFKSDFPDAVNPEWENENGYYAVEWKENGIEKELLYDENGKLVASETEIATSELPSAITDFILQNYPDYSIEEAEKQEKSDEVFYFVEIEKDNEELELQFTEDGGIVNSMVEDDEGDDDGEFDEGNEDDDANEVEINPQELPSVVIEQIQVDYPGAELLEADEITHESGDITYDIEINTGSAYMEVMYDDQGNFLGIEEEGEDNESEDE